MKEQGPLGFELWKMETEAYHEEYLAASNVNPLGVERGPPSVASQRRVQSNSFRAACRFPPRVSRVWRLRGEACVSSDGGQNASGDQS